MSYKDKTKTVEEGGTGKQSLTTYGVVTGGTTSTGNTQSITNGDADTLLTSTGSSSLPAWIEQPTIWENLATDPSSPSDGDVWFNTTSNTFKGAQVSGSSGWTTKANMSASRVSLAGGGTVDDALEFGGSVTTITQRYTELTDSWASKANMNSSQYNHGGAGTSASDVLSYGGSNAKTTTQRYDGGADSWTNKAALNTGSDNLAPAGSGSDALCSGGYNGGALNKTQRYDGGADSWTNKSNLPYSRYRWGGNGSASDALVYGGLSAQTTATRYDGSGDSWTAKGTLNVGIQDNTGSGSDAGAGISIGGDVSSPTAACEQYDEGGNSWSVIASLNLNSKDGGAANEGTAGDAIKFGGSSTTGTNNKTEILNNFSTTIVTFTTT